MVITLYTYLPRTLSTIQTYADIRISYPDTTVGNRQWHGGG